MKFFRFWSSAYALHLEEEIAYLRKQVAHERERAEMAVDELLRVRINAGPVSSTVSREAASGLTPKDDAESVIRKLLSDPEFTSVGTTE